MSMISFLRIFFGSLLFSICFASECYAESNLTAAVELPYIALENSSKSRIIVVGSAHSKINGILDLGKSTRNLLASVSLVAFEAHPNAPPGAPPHYRVQSYVDHETLNRLEQLARQDQYTGLMWNVVAQTPMPPEFAASIFFSRCTDGSKAKEALNAYREGRKSPDRLILDDISGAVDSTALESMIELNELRTEKTLLGSSVMFEAGLKSALSEDGCKNFWNYVSEVDELLVGRKIRQLYDISWKYECLLFSCRGILSGIGFSKERNVRLAERIVTLSGAHSRLAVIVGALHLDRRAGLISELNERGFFEVEDNLKE
jgi:hypothetical protein